jgi:hypothetical protein
MDIVVDHPDGTRQSYNYETNATGRITTVFSGAADPASSTNVTDGIKSVSTYNAAGLLLTCGRRPRWAFPGGCCLLDVARSMFSVPVPSDSPVVLPRYCIEPHKYHVLLDSSGETSTLSPSVRQQHAWTQQQFSF